MTGNRAAVRYAKALLSLASDQNKAEVVNNDMIYISKTIEENNELDQLLKSAVVKSELKKDALLKIFPKVNNLSKGMFDLLTSNKRIDILRDVTSKYIMLFDELNEKEKATVITAFPLTDKLESKVLKKVKELTDKSIELENIVDETIIGGFILRVGDKQYNASVLNKLNNLRREFTLN